MTAPFGAPRSWYSVVENRAGERCECAGQCGSPHLRDRCPVRHEGWHSRKRTVLTVGPRDVSKTLVESVGLPDAQLMAWCADCLSGARKALPPPEPPESDALF